MNNLGFYIREALEDKGEIYLLGMGTFKNERLPAYYDELEKKFMPPSRIITLKADLVSKVNFTDFLAKKEDVDLNTAQLKTAEALKDIEREEETYLENLGKIKKTSNGFEFIYSPTELETRFSEYDPVSEGEVLKPVEETTEPSFVEDNIEYREHETSSKRWLWPVIGTAVCVVIAAIWFLNPIKIDNQVSTEKVVATDQNSSDEGKTITEQNTKETPAIESSVQDSLNLIATEPVIQEVDNTSSLVREQGKFEIIIAAFKTMQEAEEYVRITNSKGYQVHILKNNRANNLNKISYSSYPNEKEAEIALAKVRKELNAEAWLWENKRSNINN